MCGTDVDWQHFTTMPPPLSSSTPALSSPSPSVFGMRPDRDERFVDADRLALSFRVGDDVLDLLVNDLQALELRRAVDRDPEVLEAPRHDLGDVLVLEREDARLPIDDVDLRLAEAREHRRVFAADDTGADDDHAARELGPALDVIARHDRLAVDRVLLRDARIGARRDEEVRRLELRRRPIRARDLDRMRVDELGGAAHRHDLRCAFGLRLLERLELPREDGASLRDGAVHALHHRRVRNVDPTRRAIPAIGELRRREVVREMPHRLRRQRSGMDAGSADALLLDQEHPFAEVVRAHRGRISRRASTENTEVPHSVGRHRGRG